MVALGILMSRLVGLVRLRVFGHFLGTSDAADAFVAAFRIPNLLQNLFGEGALSASFVPVYARLLSEGDDAGAARVARATGALLALVVSVIVLLGVALAPWMIDLVAPGFTGPKQELTIRLVRILWPGAGLLVLSAWCLGVLNSHSRFFLSYASPVAWNLAIIGALLWWGRSVAGYDLVVVAAWASVVGSLLQVLVQLPGVVPVVRHAAAATPATAAHLRTVVRNFLPALTSRGVVQISAYVDLLIATLLPAGAPAAINYAQTLYNLPVSLFGMSVSTAELTRMSGASGDEEARFASLRARLGSGLRQIAYFVIPAVGSFAALGHVLASALFQTGKFSRADAVYVWQILAAAAAGLLAGTLGRLYASTFFALQDTRTPMRFAILRVSLGIVLGLTFAVAVPHWLGVDAAWGAPGLALAGSLAGWTEFALLRRELTRRIGRPPVDRGFLARLWFAAGMAVLVGWVLLLAVGQWNPIVVAGVVFGGYTACYVGLTRAFGIPEARRLLARIAVKRPPATP